MGDKDNYLYTGLFILLSLIGGLVLVMALGQGETKSQPQAYKVFFSRDVSGLLIGSQVTYLGVNVGDVRNISLSGGEHPTVEVLIEIDGLTPVNRATYASLAYQGVTGVAVVNLLDDPAMDPEPLKAKGTDVPELPARDVGIAALLASGPEIGDRLNALLVQGNRLLGTQNLDRIESTLENLNRVTNALAEQQEAISAIPVRTLELVARATSAVEELELITQRIGPRFEVMSETLARSSERVDAITADFREFQNAHSNTLDQAMDRGVGELPTLIEESMDTLAAVKALLEVVERDPSRLVYRTQRNEVVVAP
ncbi:MAG: MlaD family protein [Pseudomonadota bacterium]